MIKVVSHPLFLLGVIVLLGAFLRLYRIDVLQRFLWDESRDMSAVRNIIVNKDITFFGPFNEIDGQKDFFGVFHYYLILPALWIASFDPIGPAIFTALLGTATIGLAYFWISRWEQTSVALAASALLAVSPLAVRFTRWAWNPNTIGFFAVLYLLALYYFRKKPRYTVIFIAGFVLGLLFQLHYFTIALGASILPVFYLQYKQVGIKQLIPFFLVFIGAFVLPNLTFVVFDLTHQGFYSNILLESFSGDSPQKLVSFSLQNVFTNPVVYLFDVAEKFLHSKILGIGLVISWVLYASTILRSFFKKGAKVEEVQLIVSWMAFLVIPIFFSASVDDYHSAGLWLSFALAIVYLTRKYLKKYWILLIVILMAWLVYANDINRAPSIDENVPRLRAVSAAIAEDLKETENQNSNVASLVDIDTRAIRFRYFISKENVELLGVDDYLRSDVLYAITKQPWNEVTDQPAWELSSFREAAAVEIWSDGTWTVYRVEK